MYLFDYLWGWLWKSLNCHSDLNFSKIPTYVIFLLEVLFLYSSCLYIPDTIHLFVTCITSILQFEALLFTFMKSFSLSTFKIFFFSLIFQFDMIIRDVCLFSVVVFYVSWLGLLELFGFIIGFCEVWKILCHSFQIILLACCFSSPGRPVTLLDHLILFHEWSAPPSHSFFFFPPILICLDNICWLTFHFNESS